MNWRRSALLAFLLLVATLSVVAAWSDSAGRLAAARPGAVLAAAALYSTGFLVFSRIWASLLDKVARNGPSSPDPAGATTTTALRVGLASLAGLLTPMNVGTDVLRSVLGRKYLGVDYQTTAAASLVTRELKLHASIALLVAAGAAGLGTLSARGAVAGLATLVGAGLLLAAFRSGGAARLARLTGVAGLAEATRSMNRELSVRARTATYLLFAAGFAAEWQAFAFLFRAIGVDADPAATLASYCVVHLLSRAPILPFGAGAVELAGLASLRILRVPADGAGAIVILWTCLRVAVPYLLAALAFATLPRPAPPSPQTSPGCG